MDIDGSNVVNCGIKVGNDVDNTMMSMMIMIMDITNVSKLLMTMT